MFKAIILAAGTLVLSAAGVTAHGYYRGYASPVFEYSGNAYYGYPPPSYIHTPAPIYAAAPLYFSRRGCNPLPGRVGGVGWRGRYDWR